MYSLPNLDYTMHVFHTYRTGLYVNLLQIQIRCWPRLDSRLGPTQPLIQWILAALFWG
jgi:hypothetical protein